jgi:beta-1,4-N-acetylglucosaminyltransferase
MSRKRFESSSSRRSSTLGATVDATPSVRGRSSGTTRRGKADVVLVCTPGGHLLELLALRAAWRGLESLWITMDTAETRSLLDGERVVFAHAQEVRSTKNLARNLLLAWRMTSRLRPRVIVTTGAALAVPFVWVGRVRGVRIVYVESATRVARRSLTCRLVAPIADRVYVQWPELAPLVRRAHYMGNIFGVSEP